MNTLCYERKYLYLRRIINQKNFFMEVKKSPKADLNRGRLTGTLVGLILVLVGIFVAFEWTEYDKKISADSGIVEPMFEEEMIPITEQQEPENAPPPPEAPKVEEVIQIAENDAKVQESTIRSSEETKTAVEIKYTPKQVVAPVEEAEPDDKVPFTVVEQMPEFPDGGMAGCIKFLQSNAKYPVISQENGMQGRVTVQFVVERDGSITDAKVVKSIDPYLDKEALRVVNSMPKWKPGRQLGKPVRVRYSVPVTFRLQ